MKTSESITNISAALVAMQSEAQHANFDSKNPHFKSKYASLAEVIDTVRPVLAKHKLAVIQLPAFREHVGHVLCTRILHESGEWIEDEMRLNPVKDDPQGLGSSLTYSRRYSLPGVCLIASEEDDDGNAASHAPTVTNAQARETEWVKVQGEIETLTSRDEIKKRFPGWKVRLNVVNKADVDRLTNLCQARIAQIEPAANEAKAA